MAKKPSVRYWASRKAYCCEIDGTQHILAKGPNDGPKGKTYLAAVARFGKLIKMEADKGTDDYLVSSLFNQYRIHLHATRKSAGENHHGAENDCSGQDVFLVVCIVFSFLVTRCWPPPVGRQRR